jgi:hypothetical protein
MFRPSRWLLLPVLMLVSAMAHAAPGEQVLNGDFSAGAVQFTTSYAQGSCPFEGHYMVLTNPNTCHGSWSGSDHTTGTGNFMAVNGAPSSGVTVWTEAIPVAENSSYAFSLWVSSVFVGAPATFEFRINGALVGTLTAPATLSTWANFSAPWVSGAGEKTAVISIVDTNITQSGNDFGLDDISLYGDPPTPTLSHSWGRLKLIYR